MFGPSNQGFSEFNRDIDECYGENLQSWLSGIICVLDKIQEWVGPCKTFYDQMYLMKYGYMDHHHKSNKSAPLLSRDGLRDYVMKFQDFAGMLRKRGPPLITW